MHNQSFETVVQAYQPLIKGQIKSLGIYKDHDDYYQVGLIGLWEAYRRYQSDKGEFSTFAYVTVRGKLLDTLTKEKYYGEQHELGDDYFNSVIDEHSQTPLEFSVIENYLAGLSEKEKLWVVKGILLQMKPSEIAASEGVSVETIKSRRKQAMKKLRQKWSV